MKKTAPIGFAGSHLGDSRHACAFFNAAAEKSGQFELRVNTETYLTEGRFDPAQCLRVHPGIQGQLNEAGELLTSSRRMAVACGPRAMTGRG